MCTNIPIQNSILYTGIPIKNTILCTGITITTYVLDTIKCTKQRLRLTFGQKFHDLFSPLVNDILGRILDNVRVRSNQILDGVAVTDRLGKFL